MQITIFTGPWLPLPAIEGGSTERIWDSLSQELVSLGNEVTVVSKGHPELAAKEEQKGVKHHRAVNFTQSRSLLVSLAKDFVYGVLRLNDLPKSDLIIINDFWMPILAPLRRKTVGKVVVFVGRKPRGQYRFYTGVDRFVVATTHLQEVLAGQLGCKEDDISQIACPVDERFVTSGAASGGERKKRILYVGRIHPEKGIAVLIEAFRSLYKLSSDVELRCVGPVAVELGGAGKEYERYLQGVTADLPVAFVGPIFDIDQLAKEYRTAQLFCYPSREDGGETFGVAPLEAMACGAVPVVSDLACFRDHIIDGETGFVFRGADHLSQVNDLVSVFSKAFSKNLESIRKAGQDMAYRHRPQAIAEQYYELIKGIVAGMPS